MAPRPPLAPLLEVDPELQTSGLRQLVWLRVLEGHLLAAAEGPDPTEWTTGFDVARAAGWWREECERQGW